MASIENFYKNIKVEEEKKLLTTSPKDGGSLESFYKSIPSEETEKQNIVQQQDLQDLTGTQVAQDISISGTQGVAKGLTYLADLPFMLGNALNATEGFMADKIGKFIGLDEEEIKEAKQKLLIVEKGTTQYPPGGLREKYLTYKPKTTAGEYAETIGEFAAPGGLIAKGARARKIFAGTGAASGAIGETAEQLTDSGMVGTGVGVATNLALDLYALSRGNVSKIAKDILPVKNFR